MLNTTVDLLQFASCNARQSAGRSLVVLSTIAFSTMTAHSSFAADHGGPDQIAPQPQPQPPAENDDKQGPVECAPFDADLVQWNLEVNDAGTQVTVTISYADDYDTCSSDLAVAT